MCAFELLVNLLAWLDEEITVDAGDDREADERRQATGLEDLRHAMVAIEFAADWEPS